jgi:hypothetical protein
MIQFLQRLSKRFVLLLPGLIVTYFAVRTVFPFFSHKLRFDDAFSILITYIIAAYLLVPAVIRAWRILKPPKHTPLYCVTPDGFASDPLNIGIIATRSELNSAMEQSGWYIADRHSLRNMLYEIASVVMGWSYPTAPVSNLYLLGRKQDVAFEIPAGSASSRHHVRFWATTFETKPPMSIKSIHWHNRRAHIQDDTLLWLGAASFDVGINLIRHNLQVTHMIDPDTNLERGLIVEQLRAQKLVRKVETIELDKPYRLINRVWNGSLHTDGKMSVVSLNKKTTDKLKK